MHSLKAKTPLVSFPKCLTMYPTKTPNMRSLNDLRCRRQLPGKHIYMTLQRSVILDPLYLISMTAQRTFSSAISIIWSHQKNSLKDFFVKVRLLHSIEETGIERKRTAPSEINWLKKPSLQNSTFLSHLIQHSKDLSFTDKLVAWQAILSAVFYYTDVISCIYCFFTKTGPPRYRLASSSLNLFNKLDYFMHIYPVTFSRGLEWKSSLEKAKVG